MKVVRGVNPDWADYDEVDMDALDALEEFDRGTLSETELRHLIGPEAARARAQMRYEQQDLLDDPEEL